MTGMRGLCESRISPDCEGLARPWCGRGPMPRTCAPCDHAEALAAQILSKNKRQARRAAERAARPVQSESIARRASRVQLLTAGGMVRCPGCGRLMYRLRTDGKPREQCEVCRRGRFAAYSRARGRKGGA